jgi:hypothetical protein
MNSSVENYYERQNSVFDQIQQSIVDKRELNLPEIDEHETNDELLSLASQQWQFQNIPGTQSVKNIDSLYALNKKLAEMPVLSLWNEPIDQINGGPEFFNRVKQVLLTKY